MTPIVSPTTHERILRTLGLLGLFGVFSGWLYYDGTVGWPAENLKKAIEALDPVPDKLPPMTPGISDESTAAWHGKLQAKRLTRADLIAALGTPGWERATTRDKPGEIRYFGPSGVLVVSLDGDLIMTGAYVKGKHDDAEVALQVYLASALLPVVLALLFQLGRVLTTRVTLSDAGLKVRGRAVIPFDAMTKLDAARFRKKGFVDLSYTANGGNKTVRLDEYIIRDFRAVIGEICSRTGFDSPLTPPAGVSPTVETQHNRS